MKYMITVALLLTHTCITFAQSSEDKEIPANEKVKTIRLKAERYRADGQLLIRLSGIKVIAMCSDTSQLGFAQTGMMNKKVRAVPDKPYTPFLQDFVNDMFGKVYTNPGMQLLWVIKDLRINETSRMMSEYAFVRLKAEAYLSTDKQHYRLLKQFDTVLVKGGADVTAKHGKNIAQAIQLFYLACEDAAGGYTGDATLTEAEVIAKEHEKFNVPILKDTVYKEGVYVTYKEFLANAPSVTAFEVVTEKKRPVVYTISADSSRKRMDAFWGVCYKGELYKSDDRDLAPIERKGNAFVLSQYIDDIKRRNKSMFWSAAIGGAIGASIAEAASKVHVVRWIPKIAELDAEATAVDWENGELVF